MDTEKRIELIRLAKNRNEKHRILATAQTKHRMFCLVEDELTRFCWFDIGNGYATNIGHTPFDALMEFVRGHFDAIIDIQSGISSSFEVYVKNQNY